MMDLLEEWCLSVGHPNDLDVTGLSVALEQARLKYHAQAVRYSAFHLLQCQLVALLILKIDLRSMSLDVSSAATTKPVAYTPTPPSTG
jgi:hypothetical protein